ncbi:MAG: hypothetical protein ACREA3_04675 [Nitrosotalea sp.]
MSYMKNGITSEKKKWTSYTRTIFHLHLLVRADSDVLIKAGNAIN